MLILHLFIYFSPRYYYYYYYYNYCYPLLNLVKTTEKSGAK